MAKDTISITNAAARLGISRDALKELIREGKAPLGMYVPGEVNGVYVIPRGRFEDYVSRCRETTEEGNVLRTFARMVAMEFATTYGLPVHTGRSLE